MTTFDTPSPPNLSRAGEPCRTAISPESLEKLWRELCVDFKKIGFLKLGRTQIKATFQMYASLSGDHVTLNTRLEPWKSALYKLQSLDEKML